MILSSIFRHVPGLLAASVVLPLMAGCTDTSSMNVDRFRAETAPVFQGPIGNASYIRPPGLQSPDTTGKEPLLYQNSFQRTYGLPVHNPVNAGYYGPTNDDGRTLPAIPYQRIDEKFLRQEVPYPTSEKPGTIIVDTQARFLYLVKPGGKAVRYGVGIGRDGFAWSGRGVIQWKQAWPRWTPPGDMVERNPDLRMFAAANGGMNPGLNNPLGARALYIFQNGKDTLYRVHGTPEWQSIGKATSSGCVRLLNQDVIDLFNQVPEKATIVVL